MVQLLTLNTHLLELTQKLPVGNWPLKLWWRCSDCPCPIAPNSISFIFWQVCWGKEGYIVPGLQLLVSSQPVTFETLPCKPLLSISLEQLESSSPGPLGLIQGLWIWPMGWVAISPLLNVPSPVPGLPSSNKFVAHNSQSQDLTVYSGFLSQGALQRSGVTKWHLLSLVDWAATESTVSPA